MTTKRSDFGSLTDRIAPPGVDPDRHWRLDFMYGFAAAGRRSPGCWQAGGKGRTDGVGRVVTVTDGESIETLVRSDLLRKA